MHLWLIPMVYVGASVVCGLALPRIEQAYLASYTLNLSVASAQAYLSAAASGMMALTGIVFAMSFVMVQFSAIAYSPRLVLWFARDRTLFHALGAFTATFIYALFTLAWVDRGGLACRHRHQGVVAGDQRPDDSGPDDRPARGPPAPSWRGGTGRRLRRRCERPSAPPALRLELGSGDAANEARACRPGRSPAEPRTGGDGAKLSRAPRPF